MSSINNLILAGRYEEAAQVYEKLGMLKEAGDTRRKGKDVTVLHIDVNALVKQLAERGQTLTYYCCNCGAPLKVGAKNEVLKTCPNCGYDLAVIDIAKFINEHL
jgi:DNA-directed RNA polymerase subunit RPC12/RpoP